jgi:hypothetical protein
VTWDILQVRSSSWMDGFDEAFRLVAELPGKPRLYVVGYENELPLDQAVYLGYLKHWESVSGQFAGFCSYLPDARDAILVIDNMSLVELFPERLPRYRARNVILEELYEWMGLDDKGKRQVICLTDGFEGIPVVVTPECLAEDERYGKKSARPRRVSVRSAARKRHAEQTVCVYCRRVGSKDVDPDGKDWHYDHIIPRSAGGPDVDANLVKACGSCNVKKNNRPVGVFLSELAMGGSA